MSVVGIGIDIEQASRFARVTAWRSLREMLFTEGEINRLPNDTQAVDYFAVLFSLKEALLKAIGLGIARTAWLTEIEVQLTSGGQVEISVTGHVLEHLDRAGCTRILASYGMVTGRMVVTNVILVGKADTTPEKLLP